MKRLAVAIALALVALCTSSALGVGYYTWRWETELTTDSVYDPNLNNTKDLWLTSNSGSHAVALAFSTTNGNYWTSVAADVQHGDYSNESRDSVCAYEWSGNDRRDLAHGGYNWPYSIWRDQNPGTVHNPHRACVAANNGYKLWMCSDSFVDHMSRSVCRGATNVLATQGVQYENCFAEAPNGNEDHTLAALCLPGNSTRMVGAYQNTNTWSGVVRGLHAKITDTNGDNWSHDPIQIVPDGNEYNEFREPSLAAGSGSDVYIAYRSPSSGILFERSTDYGGSWPGDGVLLGSGDHPCIAAVGQFVFVCWHNASGKIVYSFSNDNGNLNSWSTEASINGSAAGTYTHANVSSVICDGKPGLLFACECSHNGKWLTYTMFGLFVADHIDWQSKVLLSRIFTADPDLRPSLATDNYNGGDFSGRCVYNTPIGNPPGQPSHKRGFHLRRGLVTQVTGPFPPDAVIAGSGRLIARGPDGSMQYAAESRPHVVSGPADSDLLPILVAPGSQPALALDGEGNRWLSYINADTVWTMTGDGSYRVVFAGSSSAVPGQPSIVCYSEQATSGYVGSVVFAVYDTAGGTSKILYARVDTSAVVLDTIESVANLRDSLPCISIYKTDTLLVTWQHGTDSVLCSLLADYGPGTSNRPGPWSSPNLVTASGYHPMSVFEQGGSVLNCVWTGKSGNNYAIHRATLDLSGGMFPSWTAQSDPSGNATSEKGNSVYAGLGVTCWQAKVNGKWVIKGKVRGEEETFVANDTDAYHPHAVAESSAISPSIDQGSCPSPLD